MISTHEMAVTFLHVHFISPYFTLDILSSTLSDLGLQHDQVITVSLTIACLVYGWVGIVVYATFGCSAGHGHVKKQTAVGG